MRVVDLLEEYVLVLRSANRSPRTIDSYRTYTDRLSRFFAESEREDEIATVTASDLREFILWLQDRYAPQTVQNTYQGVRTLILWAKEEELLENDPTRRIAIPKVPRLEFDVFSVEDIEKMLRFWDTRSLVGSRNFAIIILLFDSGIRLGELVGLRVEDLHFDEGYISVFGKGAKYRPVPVSSRTLRAIRRYQTLRNDIDVVDSNALWVARDGYPLGRWGVRTMLERLGKKLGIKIHPHKFRHSFAVNALRNDAREFDIQQCLGHTTLAMTRHYARQASADLIQKHKKFSPADRLRIRT
jgi:integrase/recombinase XerD